MVLRLAGWSGQGWGTSWSLQSFMGRHGHSTGSLEITEDLQAASIHSFMGWAEDDDPKLIISSKAKVWREAAASPGMRPTGA